MKILFMACLAMLVSATAARPAFAQTSRRSDLGLFGQVLGNPRHRLSAEGSLGVTFFDVLLPKLPEGVDAGRDHGWGAIGTGGLRYGLATNHVNVNASLAALATYYPGQAEPLSVRWVPIGEARSGWSWDLSRRTQLSFSTGLQARPLYYDVISPFTSPSGDLGTLTDARFLPPEASAVEGTRLLWDNVLSLRHSLSRRVSATGYYGFRRDWVVDTDDPRTFVTQMAGGRLEFGVTQHLSVRGGYIFGETRSDEFDRPLRTHQADVGADYNRGTTIRLTRNTTLTMQGGATAYVDRFGNQRYAVIGNADLRHELGRTWSSSLAYQRGVSAAEILFTETVVYDRLLADLHGLVSRRVGAHANAILSRETVAGGGPDQRARRAAFNAGVQTALTRMLAVTVDYSVYYRQFGSRFTLPGGLANESAVQAVRAFGSVSVPLLQRGRRANAAR